MWAGVWIRQTHGTPTSRSGARQGPRVPVNDTCGHAAAIDVGSGPVGNNATIGAAHRGRCADQVAPSTQSCSCATANAVPVGSISTNALHGSGVVALVRRSIGSIRPPAS